MKISVIVPVYKVEKYIEKCIQSLLNQTYTNFEALIIDDGSPDQSIAIAKKIVGNDSRFIFLEKENGGQGSARNLALDIAKGDYIAFLDSDDYYDALFLEQMLAALKKTNADIAICDIKWVTINGDLIRTQQENINTYYESQDFCLIKNSIKSYLWNKVFKKNIFDNFRINEEIIYEDEHLLFRLIYRRQLIKVSEALYNYVQRNTSTVNSYNPKFIPSMHELIIVRKNFLIEKGLFTPTYFTAIYLYYICRIINDLSLHSPHPIEELTSFKKELNLDYFNTKNIRKSFLSTTNKIKLLLLQLHPSLPIVIGKIYREFHHIKTYCLNTKK